MKDKDPALVRLEEACAGLLYPSEEDHPLTVFETEDAPEECDRPGVVWMRADEFFDGLEGKAADDPWARLRSVLEHELENVHFGRGPNQYGNVHVFFFGRSPTGKFIGARTLSVET